MKFALLTFLLAGNSAQVPVGEEGPAGRGPVISYVGAGHSDGAGSVGRAAGHLPRNGTIEGIPDRKLVALSCALTLLGAYLLFAVLYFLYVAIKGSGRAYVRLDAEGGRSAWDRAKEQLGDQASSASRGIIQSVERGKEKVKHMAHGKPVLYPAK